MRPIQVFHLVEVTPLQRAPFGLKSLDQRNWHKPLNCIACNGLEYPWSNRRLLLASKEHSSVCLTSKLGIVHNDG